MTAAAAFKICLQERKPKSHFKQLVFASSASEILGLTQSLTICFWMTGCLYCYCSTLWQTDFRNKFHFESCCRARRWRCVIQNHRRDLFFMLLKETCAYSLSLLVALSTLFWSWRICLASPSPAEADTHPTMPLFAGQSPSCMSWTSTIAGEMCCFTKDCIGEDGRYEKVPMKQN